MRAQDDEHVSGLYQWNEEIVSRARGASEVREVSCPQIEGERERGGNSL